MLVLGKNKEAIVRSTIHDKRDSIIKINGLETTPDFFCPKTKMALPMEAIRAKSKALIKRFIELVSVKL
jgi:ribosomal protein S9